MAESDCQQRMGSCGLQRLNMSDQIDGFEILAILDYMKGVQTDQLHSLVMGEDDLDQFNPDALRQIVRQLKELEECYDDGREPPRFDFSTECDRAERLIEMLEKEAV